MSENYSEVFTLFVLGTDGKYTPDEGYLSELSAEPLKKEKLKQAKLQNTLSFIAKSIAAEKMADGLIDIKDAKGNLPEQMKLFLRNVVLLDGPDTAGTEVHNITAYGVLAILNAILQDKKKINLVGFSRGAVIIIQIVNYLQSMKDRLDPSNRDNLTIRDFYTKILMCGKLGQSLTSGGWIRNRIEYSEQSIMSILENPDHLKKIIDFFNSPQIELSMFCLDPVQGPTWNHEKHYQIPKMVKNIEILYHEDERSYGFNPLYPNVQDSISSYLHIPGFHGIGDGNLFDHNFDHLNLTEKELSARRLIQEIVFLKIFRMLKNSGVQFQPVVSFKTNLDFCLSEFIKLNDIDDLLLKYYQELLNCLPQLPINSWRNGAYVDVTIVAPKDLCENPRQIKYEKKKLKRIDELLQFNIRNDRKFINKEHLHLAFKFMLNDYKASSHHDVSIGQIAALLNRLVNKIEEGELDRFFSNHEYCQEQSKIAYKNIKSYIKNLISMYFKQNLSSKEIGVIKKFYNKLSNLKIGILNSDDSIVRERKIHLIKHINGCIQQSYEEQFMKIFEFIQLLNEFIGSKNIDILDIMINKKHQFSNFQQGPQFYGSEIFEIIEMLHFSVIPFFYRQLNALIFSCQVLPSHLFVFKMDEELLKVNKDIWDWLIKILQSSVQNVIKDPKHEDSISQPSTQVLPSQLFVFKMDEELLKVNKDIWDCKSLQSSVQNVIKDPKHEDSISQPSTRFINQNLGITMLLTASIALSLAAGLFFILGSVAMVPCVVMGVIGLLSLIVAAGNALCLQDYAFTPPKEFSLR